MNDTLKIQKFKNIIDECKTNHLCVLHYHLFLYCIKITKHLLVPMLYTLSIHILCPNKWHEITRAFGILKLTHFSKKSFFSQLKKYNKRFFSTLDTFYWNYAQGVYLWFKIVLLQYCIIFLSLFKIVSGYRFSRYNKILKHKISKSHPLNTDSVFFVLNQSLMFIN